MKPSVVSKVPTRKDVEDFQEYIATLPQCDDMVLREYYADGMYCRELEVKKGTILVGRVHKKEHLFMVIKGKVNIITDSGLVELKAPHIIVSQPGTKRVAYHVEDCTIVTVHRVSSYDSEEIEKEIVEDDPKALFDFKDKLRYPELANPEVLRTLE